MKLRSCVHAISLTICIAAGVASHSTVAAAQSFAPVAVVNDQVITGYDVAQRALLNSITAGGGASDSKKALSDLIDDILRLQAAQRAGIDPTPAEVRTGFAEISRLNQRDPNQMRSGFLSRGVSEEALDSQIKAEVAWRQLILQRFGTRATVTEGDVDEMMVSETDAKPGETEYLLAEMRFPIADGGEAAARAKAERIVGILSSGRRFSEIARTESSGPTALSGGDLGWNARSNLSAQAAPIVASMNVDRISEPFVDGTDVVLLGLRATREAGGGNVTTYTLSQLVVGVEPGASQAEANAALARANAVRGELTTCADVASRQSQYLPISGELGDLTLAAMPGPVREAVTGLEVGNITQPVRSNDGFHVIIVCDKKASGPSPDAKRARASGQLRSERLERFARSLLRELKREAVIERR